MESPRFQKEDTFDYSFNNYPPAVRVIFEELKREHELANGGLRIYHKGFRMVANLIWENSICTIAQYEILRAIVNTHDAFNFYPYPETYPNSVFSVRIMSGMSLSEWHWVDNGYKGTLELITIDKITDVPQWT